MRWTFIGPRNCESIGFIRDAGTSVVQRGGQYKGEGNANIWKTKKSLPIIKPVTKEAQGSYSPLKKILLEKCVGHVFAPLSVNSSPLLVSHSGYGLPNFACYTSTIMLTSKILKQTIENLFRFNPILINHKITYEKTPFPLLPSFESQEFNTTALRHPCLPLSAFTASLRYLPGCLRSRVTCDKTPNIVTRSEYWKFFLPCCYYTIKTNSKTIR